MALEDPLAASAPVETEEPDTPDTTDHGALFVQLKRWFDDDWTHYRDWRGSAREDYAFYALDQYSEDDKKALKDAMRPIVVFDRTKRIIDAISGQEVNNRQEARCIPREMGDVQVNEFLSETMKWFRDRAGAESEESAAFRDTLISGMGWTETWLNEMDGPEAEPRIDRVPPLEMIADCTAKKDNLTDARRIFRVKDVPFDEARIMFPAEDGSKRSVSELDAAWARDDDGPIERETNRPDRYAEGSQTNESNRVREDGMVTIVECQWWEREAYYEVSRLDTGEKSDVSEEDYPKLLERTLVAGIPVQGMKRMRKVYKRAFIGSQILEVGPAPFPKGFSYECITGYRDENAGTWFGVVKAMKDPQRWANKWLSQTLHILNSQAAGGIMIEEGAVEDQRDLEKNWTKPNWIAKFRPGALSQNKIQAKPQAQFPAGHAQLMQMAFSSIHESAGVNMELLGMREATQPGVLENRRVQQGMQILAPLFDSLRKYRHRNAFILLHMIQNDLSDGRLIRIGGQGAEQVVPLVRDQTLGEYDIIIDDAPTAPNQKEQVWAMLTQMLPMIGDQMTPEIWSILLEYSPLPSSVVAALKEAITPPEPTEEDLMLEQAQKQLALADAREEIAGKGAERKKDEAQAIKYLVEAMNGRQQAISNAMRPALPARPMGRPGFRGPVQ